MGDRLHFLTHTSIWTSAYQYGFGSPGSPLMSGQMAVQTTVPKIENEESDTAINLDETSDATISKTTTATIKIKEDGKEKEQQQQEEESREPTPKDLDRIVDLPGLSFTPSFEQYSGYLKVSKRHERNIFYWFVESENDPDNDPVILWTNGGPGCSGLYGFGNEHGPFFLSANGTLTENPFSWNKLANILYIEQPAGVGFSYSERKKDYRIIGDDRAAKDNYSLIKRFFERFPEKRSNDFYISSESYGGHYMPQLTLEILTRNTKGFINFKGAMVGNPYVDPFTNTQTQFQTWYQHGLVPWPLYHKYVDHCNDQNSYLSGRCQNYMEQMYQELGKGINPYGLDYPVCLEVNEHRYGGDRRLREVDAAGDLTGESDHGRRRMKAMISSSSQSSTLLNHTTSAISELTNNPPFLHPQDIFRPCAERHLEAYLNRPDVVEAIHANPKYGTPWKACSSKIQYSREDSLTPVVDLYKELIQMMNTNTDLKLLVFSGDDDSVCSLAGTQTWIWDLGVSARGRDTWNLWQVEDQTAGFVTHFFLDNPRSSFTFATVHGAGHEVPAYRPMEALELLGNYLTGKW